MDVISAPINMNDPRLIEWVNDKSRRKGNTLELPASLSIPDMTAAAHHQLPGTIGDVYTITAIRRQYRLEKDGQPFCDVFSIIPLKTNLKASATTVLGVRNRTPDGAKKYIIDSFNAFSPANVSATAYMATCITKYNEQSPVKITGNEFQLFMDVTFEWVSIQRDLADDNWLHQVYEGDASSLLPDLCPKEGQNLGGDGFRLIFVDEKYLSAIPPITDSANVVKIEQGDIGKNGVVEDAVRQRADEQSQVGGRDCDFMQTQTIRITSIKAPMQSKWELAWVYFEGNGCGFNMLMPAWFTRSASKVLYATVRWAKPQDALKKIFMDSAYDAAKLAVAVALLADNLDAGRAIFKAEFWRLIKERALQLYECLIPDIYIADEAGKWKPAGWPEPDPDPAP